MQIVKRESKPGVIILELSGPLQMGVECKRLELAVDELLRDNHTRVILDLSRVTKLDSGGLGKIVSCFSRLKNAGGSLCLTGTTGMIDGLLKLTHADRFLKCYPTARAAEESLSGPAKS
ncbi:MAG TPA: STAS domain-containing protein [Candidatus Angelobacter sp.]|nr:STAS domain-containing protein [Candidatus Angelobacter sp.]